MPLRVAENAYRCSNAGQRARLASPAVQKKDGFGMIAWRMLGQHMSAPIYIDFQELFAQNIYGCSLVKGYVVH